MLVTYMNWRPQSRDLVWIILFLALHFTSRIRNDAQTETLAALALFELAEPRLSWFQGSNGARLIGIGIRLLLSYLLMGVTGGITSSYYLILLVPVVRGASLFGPLLSLSVTTVASLSYLSFLLFLDFDEIVIPLDQQQEISFRILFLYLTAWLTYQLARTNREQAERYQSLAEELSASNTNLVAAQAEVQRSERLAALGQLTAGLAHELRNPLGTIKNSAEMLARRLPVEDEIARELSGYISSEVDRTNDLVKRFLDFARPFRLRIAPAELADVIDRAIANVEASAASREVVLLRNDSPDLPAIPIDAQWVERLLTNLLSNAIEACPPGATVTLGARPSEGGVELTVTDNGRGIAPENLANIFNPFFTTKAEGTGLGLAIVSKIVDEHHGRILVESQPGAGATFRVWLPDRQEGISS
jgi:signal transduction histidine kinase